MNPDIGFMYTLVKGIYISDQTQHKVFFIKHLFGRICRVVSSILSSYFVSTSNISMSAIGKSIICDFFFFF